MQRYEDQRAGEVVGAGTWIGDAVISLGDLMSQCKEWRHEPDKEQVCLAIRNDAAAVANALEKLEETIQNQARTRK